MRPLCVVNPRAGGGRTSAHIAEVRRVIERHLGSVDIEVTTRPGHAIDVAREGTLAGRPLVLALGGDGTLHEVANGVLDAEGRAAVGFIGLGTGGDFRRTLGIEHRLDRYLESIAHGEECSVDVGRVRYRAAAGAEGQRWFLNILSVGLGGLVDRRITETTKAFGGKAAYLMASLRALTGARRGRLKCESSFRGARDSRFVDAYMLAICNGRYFGGGMHVAPMAIVDDGRFEVVSMNAPSKLAFVAFSRRIYDGSHLTAEGVEHFECDRISIDIENDSARGVFLLDVDGEALGGLPIDVELVPKALRVRARLEAPAI